MLTFSNHTLPAPTGGEQRFFFPILFALLVFIAVSCGGEVGKTDNYKNTDAQTGTLPNHVKYSFYKRHEKGRKPKEGDMVTFSLKVENHKNQELSNTVYIEQPYSEGESYFIYKPFYREIFAITAENDSLSFWISVDSIRNKQGDLKTDKIQSGTLLKYTLKMLRIRSKEEIKREIKEKYSKQNKTDSATIAQYIQELKKKELHIELQTTETGLRYYIRKPGKGNPPQEGDTVMVNYVQKSIDGRLFGKSDGPTDFVIGYTMPKGLEEGLSLMTEGASSVFILPTELGYGENPPDNMPKNAILVLEVDMIKMKH